MNFDFSLCFVIIFFKKINQIVSLLLGSALTANDVSMTFELISNRLRAFIPLYGMKRRSVRCLQYFHFVTER